jgi:hypothetical protein
MEKFVPSWGVSSMSYGLLQRNPIAEGPGMNGQ